MLKQLELNELSEIYSHYGPLYFPPDELKPLSSVKALWNRGIYEAFGLYSQDETLLAYACFVRTPEPESALLDYYAVLEGYRSGGIGGGFLKLLREHYRALSGIFIETEEPSSAAFDGELSVRSRRIGFYQRNGCLDTGVKSRLFGVDYRILYLPCGGGEAPAAERGSGSYAEELGLLYQAMFSEKLFRTRVEITAE